MKFQFLILFFLSCNILCASELSRVPRKNVIPKTLHNRGHLSRQKSPEPVFDLTQYVDPRALAIEWFRAKFCSQIIKDVSKEEFIADNYLFLISRYAAAKFNWDVISYAFVQAMNGKEIDQVWTPAFKQAGINVIQQKITRRLKRRMPKKKETDNCVVALIKDHSPSLIAQGLVFATRNYVYPVVERQSLSLLKAIFTKQK